jgi:hypothetical protein
MPVATPQSGRAGHRNPYDGTVRGRSNTATVRRAKPHIGRPAADVQWFTSVYPLCRLQICVCGRLPITLSSADCSEFQGSIVQIWR